MKLHLLHGNLRKKAPWGGDWPFHYDTFCGRHLYARYTQEYRVSLDWETRNHDVHVAPYEFLTISYYARAATKDIVAGMPPLSDNYQHFWEIGHGWRTVLVATERGWSHPESRCLRCLKHYNKNNYLPYWPDIFDEPEKR